MLRPLLRPLLLGTGATVAALLVYAVLVGLLGVADAAADLEVGTTWVVVSSALFSVPFALGSWVGTRIGLRTLTPPAAVVAGAGGAAVVFAIVTAAGGGTDALSVVLPILGTAAGAGAALRVAGVV